MITEIIIEEQDLETALINANKIEARHCTTCLIATAISRNLERDVEVAVRWFDFGLHTTHIDLPESVSTLLGQFDDNMSELDICRNIILPKLPFKFTVDIPEEYLNVTR